LLPPQDGWTALHWAAYRVQGPIVTMLLEKGADHTITSRVSALLW
jgi:ankyrin repeat protein